MTARLTCRELIEFLDSYVENELSPDRRAVFDDHLAICPDCVDYLEAYESTRRLTRAAFPGPEDAPPEEVPADLLRAILAARSRSR